MTSSELAALAGGRVPLDQCVSCGACQRVGMPHCRTCGADQMRRIEASGTGRVVTFTRVRHRFSPEDPPPPYLTAVVRLDEGPRVLAVAADTWAPLSIGDVVMLRPGRDGLAPRMVKQLDQRGGSQGG